MSYDTSEIDLDELSLEEYRGRIEDTQVPSDGDRLSYMALGVTGEAGEVAEAVKKLRRRPDTPADFEVYDDATVALLEELGDLMWYVDRICNKVNLTIGEVLYYNSDKVESLHSGGDE